MPHGKRLVLAAEQDAGVDILHACGGNARCTTCRVEFLAGEPAQMTEAEKNKLAERGLTGVRLACQIVVDHDMSIRAISRLEGSGRADAGGAPAAEITPPPVWVDRLTFSRVPTPPKLQLWARDRLMSMTARRSAIRAIPFNCPSSICNLQLSTTVSPPPTAP